MPKRANSITRKKRLRSRREQEARRRLQGEDEELDHFGMDDDEEEWEDEDG